MKVDVEMRLVINEGYRRECAGQIRYPSSYSLHAHLRLFLEKMSTREPLSEQLNQPSVAVLVDTIELRYRSRVQLQLE